jgi:hypothetical protein
MSEGCRQLGFDTKAVRLGYKPDVSNNYSIVPPIGLSSTYQQDDPSTHRVGAPENTVVQTGYVTVATSLPQSYQRYRWLKELFLRQRCVSWLLNTLVQQLL